MLDLETLDSERTSGDGGGIDAEVSLPPGELPPPCGSRPGSLATGAATGAITNEGGAALLPLIVDFVALQCSATGAHPFRSPLPSEPITNEGGAALLPLTVDL